MLPVGDSSHSFRKISSIKKLDAVWLDINYTEKRFPLRKLSETKEESSVATLSSWRNQKKQVGFWFLGAFLQIKSFNPLFT